MYKLVVAALTLYFLSASTGVTSPLPDCPVNSVPDTCDGKYTWNDGTFYDGEWRDGVIHGTGTITYPNGDVFKGNFENNKKIGCGTRITKGEARTECYKNGEYVGEMLAERLTPAQTSPYAEKCAASAKLEGKYRYFKGIVLDHTTYSWLYGDEARKIEQEVNSSSLEDFFVVLVQQEFRDVRGTKKFKIWACEFTINDGVQVIRFNPGCDSMFQVLDFVSLKTASYQGFSEYFFYRDQTVINAKECYK